MARKTSGKHGRREASSRKSPLPSPGRAADRPFCAYLGAAGETCAQTTNLAEVLVIEGPPRLVWVACPRHREAVRQMAASFVLRSQATPLPVPFRYQGESYEVWVTGTPHTGGSSGA
ncbi:MAG TPA: hypothetical protein VFV38_42340 [Ktedonobacteraceae bacterium]|nr:hypothetical protein [Ktedonobacteraceae bacterium]